MNPRPVACKATALPLSYPADESERIIKVEVMSTACGQLSAMGLDEAVVDAGQVQGDGNHNLPSCRTGREKRAKRPSRRIQCSLSALMQNSIAMSRCLFSQPWEHRAYALQESYFLGISLESLSKTSCAPPSMIEVDETSVSLAFCCSSLMLKAPQLHMVEVILPSDSCTLSFSGPA